MREGPIIKIDEEFMKYVVENNQIYQRLKRDIEIQRANSRTSSSIGATEIKGITDIPVMDLFLKKTCIDTRDPSYQQLIDRLLADKVYKLQSSIEKDLRRNPEALKTQFLISESQYAVEANILETSNKGGLHSQ